MLVQFSNASGASITMYEKDASALIVKMGHSGSIPSAIRAEDLSEALKQLEAALASEQALPEDNRAETEDSEDEEKPVKIGMNVRAYPLIQLIKRSITEKKALMWEHSNGLL